MNLDAGYRAAAELRRDKQPPLTPYSSLAAGLYALMRVYDSPNTTAGKRDVITGKLDEMLDLFQRLPESLIWH